MTEGGQPDRRVWVRSVLDRYEGALTRYAARITGNVDRARDVVQETFLRFCSDGAPREDARVAQWLFTVCRNQAVDARRKDRRMTPLVEQDDRCDEREQESPSAGLEVAEEASRVLRALARLPARQQEVVRLRFQNGLSYREISGVMHITVTNVGYLIHTALKTLRETLGAQCDSQSDVSGSPS